MADLLISNVDGDTLAETPLGSRCAITIGRSEGNDLVINNDSVSRRHVLVFDHDGTFYATDLGSKTGLCDEQGATRFHAFTSKDSWVRMGPAFLWVVGAATQQQQERPSLHADSPASPIHLAREFSKPPEMMPRSVENPLPCHLVFQENGNAIRLLDLTHVGRLTIGRGRSCDLTIDDPAVSRLHCLIYREGSRFFIADAGSSQGLRADGSRWLRKRLETGTLLQFGRITARVLAPESPVDLPGAAADMHREEIDPLDVGSAFTEATSSTDAGPVAPKRL